MKRACDFMQTQLVTVSPQDPLERVRSLLSEEEIHGAPVVDEKGLLVGIVTSDDLLSLAAAELGGLAVAVRTQSPHGDLGRRES